jgi:DNA-binding SARP family transcriptional activator
MFTVLGPVRIKVDATPYRVPRAQARGVLALLVIDAGRWLSASAITEAMWAGRPPPTVRTQVQASVSAIRHTLAAAGLPDAVESSTAGYRLAVDARQTDVGLFDATVRAADAAAAGGDLAEATRSLTAALELYGGEPLADAAGAFVDGARARLVDGQLTAADLLARVQLRSSRPADAVARLAPLVAAHPTREALRARLVLALYRSGRQVEALSNLRAYRRFLAEHAGIEPGRELVELELAVLRGDPALDAPPTGGPAEQGRPRPALLPPDIGGFTGRETELRRLDELVRPDQPGPPARRGWPPWCWSAWPASARARLPCTGHAAAALRSRTASCTSTCAVSPRTPGRCPRRGHWPGCCVRSASSRSGYRRTWRARPACTAPW